MQTLLNFAYKTKRPGIWLFQKNFRKIILFWENRQNPAAQTGKNSLAPLVKKAALLPFPSRDRQHGSDYFCL
jgi:hypothetical protein|tara:strand:- start:76 stop:291 length:216 start_codon:yes stop_codon:yes gene_type:complete